MPPDESFTPNSSKPFRGIKAVYEEMKVAQSVEDDEISPAWVAESGQGWMRLIVTGGHSRQRFGEV